ncbi:pentatricopeptide repeat-containing protein 1, mitochondrial [Betta splendens]|uniref:Pentatricopeptide repeat-containing protein 1, mitochondrial n=1 Tax=Betta splendens TaxID=158456 RepID=A0A6P7M6F9_BETSP|nr:pentatricopeptide repeat-containing protein 1, mitochondrial [Betta splendens]
MFKYFAYLCARNGRRISAPAANLSAMSSVRILPRTPTLTAVEGSRLQRTSRLLIPADWQLPRRLSGGPVSSADAGSPGCPSEDGEVFGSLSADMSSKQSYRKSSPDFQDMRHREDDATEEEASVKTGRRPGRRNTPYWYFLQCKKRIKDNKLQEALDLFSGDMLQGERLQPEEFNYTVLIGGCGRAGRLKEAFRLYNDMKKRGLVPVDATYTALFNACAESPSKQAGLQQALKLEQELRRKNCPLSTITYHALLKTHAIANQLQACFHTLREMLQDGHVVSQETFHYLLMGCLKDKQIGFRMALQVWRQMLKSGILPDTKNYNLLLRIARDCGIGDPALATDVLLRLDGEIQKEDASNAKSDSKTKDIIDIDLLEKQLFIQADSRRNNESSACLVPVRQEHHHPLELADNSAAPNLLDIFEGRKGAVVSLSTVDGAFDRLSLIGGATGFLEKMVSNGLSPDLRTLTLLADTMEPGRESLLLLLKAAKQHHVKLDTAFFNSAIRRAARAGEMDTAKSVLGVMRQRNVNVDVQTFGSLALGCQRQNDALQLLKDMEGVGLRPNVQVFSALIGRAARRLDYVYLKKILQTMSDMRVWPNKVIIKQLEFAAQYPPNYNQYKSRNNYLVHIDGFRGYYQQWLRKMPAQSDDDTQVELQLQTDSALLKAEAVDGLTEAERNQRAAARRYNSRNKDKTRHIASTL